jgi:hypothetical protein
MARLVQVVHEIAKSWQAAAVLSTTWILDAALTNSRCVTTEENEKWCPQDKSLVRLEVAIRYLGAGVYKKIFLEQLPIGQIVFNKLTSILIS